MDILATHLALTMFKNQNKSPFLFNLHTQEGANTLGHTLIVGGSGSGKTTLVSWLILNCFKYDINIVVFDKLNGLYSITNYLNGEYIDGNEDNFKLNPFSLEYSNENKSFLIDWLAKYIDIDKNNLEDVEAIASLQKVLDQTFRILKQQNTEFNINEIKESILKQDNENIKLKLELASLNPIFNALSDSINLESKLNIINMDFIESLEKEAGLIAYYVLYKILYLAKIKLRDFSVLLMSLEHINNHLILDRINYIITQARKVNGVIALPYKI